VTANIKRQKRKTADHADDRGHEIETIKMPGYQIVIKLYPRNPWSIAGLRSYRGPICVHLRSSVANSAALMPGLRHPRNPRFFLLLNCCRAAIALFTLAVATACSAQMQNFHSEGDAHTKFVGIEAQGSKFVYVLDHSGSMGELGGKPLREAKKELLASLDDLNEQNQFYLIFYNEQPRLFDMGTSLGRLPFATPANKKQAANFISGITVGGGTDHMSALVAALRFRPDVIFLLTDGEEKDDPTPEDLKRLDRLNGGSSIINVVQFADAPRPETSLIKLAQQNRGKHVFVDIKNYGETAPAAK
jgi:hypothetical protein